jgi:8-oxo-dGTP diphosphatase
MRAQIPLSAHIILLHGSHVLLLQKNNDDKSWPNHWGVPAGKVENDELFRESAIRELEEETGVTVDVTDIDHEFILNNGTRVYYF